MKTALRLFFRLERFSLLALVCIFGVSGCKEKPAPNGPVVIKYWEKWTGFESDAMQAVVNDFNASQNRIFVDYCTVSQIDRKLMLATAGGVPPDVAGVWSNNIPVYAENNALTPLDKRAADAGITRDKYIDIFWRVCSHRDHLWALPSTPTSIGLVWNKKLFRAAGLDPERPPKSIAELDEYAQKLVKYRPDGGLESIGFIPGEPNWFDSMWGCWFGGELWDGEKTITADAPKVLAAYQWVESYPKRYGASQLLSFRDGFGNFASPQNAFFTGRVAMVLQGVWIHNFIKNYAPPDFEWGAAPFPTADPEKLPNVTIAGCDVLVIPAGASHPKEAFEFISYVNSQKVMEKLCMGQLKFTPLRDCSPEFLANHPNPYIKVFADLAKSPNATALPPLTTWTQYGNDLANAVTRIQSGNTSAAEALRDVNQRQQQVFDRSLARWKRLSPKLTEEWNKQ